MGFVSIVLGTLFAFAWFLWEHMELILVTTPATLEHAVAAVVSDEFLGPEKIVSVILGIATFAAFFVGIQELRLAFLLDFSPSEKLRQKSEWWLRVGSVMLAGMAIGAGACLIL